MENQPTTYMKTEMLPEYLILVEPLKYKINTESLSDNPHMKNINLSPEELSEKILLEHQNYQKALEKYGAKYKVVKQVHPDAHDSIYACDWFGSIKNEDFPGGILFVFPMHGNIRRLEKNYQLINELKQNFEFYEDLSFFEEKNLSLESFGTLSIDFHNRTAYANLSERSSLEVLNYFIDKLNFYKKCKEEYTLRLIDSVDPVSGSVCFHTGLYLNILDSTAFFCKDFVKDEKDAEKIINELSKDKEFKYDVILLRQEECLNMGANLVEVRIDQKYGKNGLCMSSSAYNAFSEENLKKLKGKFELIVVEVSTIHHCGGGSVRCMASLMF